MLLQLILYIVPCTVRIPIRIRQARLRRQDDSLSITIHGAPLKNDSRLKTAVVQALGDAARDLIVIFKGRVLPTPCVIVPIN
jgi:uncharacterized membrane protein